MKKDYHYLPVRAKELWWRYGSIYFPLVVLLAFSDWSILSIGKFTIVFWIIFGLLLLQEYFGTYFLIKDGFLIQNLLFGNKRNIPIENITRIVKSRFGLAHSESMECYYKKGEIEKEFTITLFSREPKEIMKFITDIYEMNQNIVIDPELKKWLEKKSNK